MKPQGSSINKLGSKYSPAPVLYNRALFETGATDLLSSFIKVWWEFKCTVKNHLSSWGNGIVPKQSL